MHLAQPFIEKDVHPTVIVRGYMKALQDGIAILDSLAFPIDVNDSKWILAVDSHALFLPVYGTVPPLFDPRRSLVFAAACYFVSHCFRTSLELVFSHPRCKRILQRHVQLYACTLYVGQLSFGRHAIR